MASEIMAPERGLPASHPRQRSLVRRGLRAAAIAVGSLLLVAAIAIAEMVRPDIPLEARAQAYELTNPESIPLFQYTRYIYVLRSESWNNSCKKITQLPVCEHTNADSSVHWSGHTV